MNWARFPVSPEEAFTLFVALTLLWRTLRKKISRRVSSELAGISTITMLAVPAMITETVPSRRAAVTQRKETGCQTTTPQAPVTERTTVLRTAVGGGAPSTRTAASTSPTW